MLVGEAGQYLVLALFVGGMYFDVPSGTGTGVFDRSAAMFFVVVTAAFTPPFTVITAWQEERKLVKREVGQNIYSLAAFFWARTLVVLPIEMLFALVVRLLLCCTSTGHCATVAATRASLPGLVKNCGTSWFHAIAHLCVASSE